MRKCTEGMEDIPIILKLPHPFPGTLEHSTLLEGMRPERQSSTQERVYYTKCMGSMGSEGPEFKPQLFQYYICDLRQIIYFTEYDLFPLELLINLMN